MVWKGFFGDILYCDEYIFGLVEDSDKEKMIPLMNPFITMPWKTMRKFGIEGTQELREEAIYCCPWTDNKYYWFVPYALIVNGSPDVYKPIETPSHNAFYDYCLDLKWHAQYFKEDDLKPNKILPNGIQAALLGHGYTSFTFPSDGDGKIFEAKIKLKNGDFIAGFIWVWYNK